MKNRINIAVLSLVTLLLVAGCGDQAGAGSTATTVVSTPKAAQPGSTTLPAGTNDASTTNTPSSGDTQTGGNLDCQAIANAAFDLNSSEPTLIVLARAGGSALNTPDSPIYKDTNKLRADLDILAVLPDPTDATEIEMMGKISEAIPQFRQMLDLIDKDAKAAPPADGTAPSDPELQEFGTKLITISTAINSAVGDSCPNTAPDVSQVP